MTVKKKVIIGGLILVAAWICYIIFHRNPLADPKQEIVKKIISIALLTAAYLVFVRFYDRIVILPFELYQNRELIWKLSKISMLRRTIMNAPTKLRKSLRTSPMLPVMKLNIRWQRM